MKKNRLATHLGTLSIAVGMGLLFLVLSFVRILGDAGSAALGGNIINAVLAGGIWGTTLAHNLLLFGAAEVLVHVGLALVCWALAALSRIAWPASPHSERTWLLLWFTLSALWLLIANAALFPWSSLGGMYSEYVEAKWLGISIFNAYSAVMIAGLLWLSICLVRHLFETAAPIAIRMCACLLGIAFAGVISRASLSHAEPTKHANPHVILIGLDSLRADAVETPEHNTPSLDEFLKSAIRFSDTTTPLARTFPSWVSIISGKNPHTTGAVINLQPRELIQTGDTLPTLLSRNGYQSVYAIDEVRFSNLDRSFGFDQMIAPPIGATDFMLGFFADAPLSNLLANTRAGELLFPYLYANRAIAHTYDPDSFVKRMDRELDFSRPTFLAAHFTLAHWPYFWADAPQSPAGESDGTSKRFYRSAVARLDQQFANLMSLLQQKGALENAVVIVLSDHGESLGAINPSAETQDPSIGVEYDEEHLVGHGTSVFSPSQYKVVFAMKSYGNSLIPDTGARIHSPVSLEDLTPTVLDMLSIRASSVFDGHSLTPLLSGKSDQSFANRIRFTETEFNPKGFFGGGGTVTASEIEKAATYYRVDPRSDRISVRRDLLPEVVQRRQFAALMGDKMLAVIPIETADGLIRRTILMEDGHDPLIIADPANGDRDVKSLWTALNSRFPGIRGDQSAASTLETQ